MVRYVVISSFVLGAIQVLINVWSAVERPLLEFVMLGIIPGTAVQLSFEHILLIGLAAFLIFWFAEHKSSLKRIARMIDLTSL